MLTHLKTYFELIHTEISQLLCCFLFRAVSNIVQDDIFQYRRLNHCHLLLVVSNFSGRAKCLGNYLMQGFLSIKSLSGEMLVCLLFPELILHRNLQEQQGKGGTAWIFPCFPLKSPWAQSRMVRRGKNKMKVTLTCKYECISAQCFFFSV